MESDHEHTQNAPSSHVEAAKSRFLDSMGLGENALRELAESGRDREAEDEVALSAQPEGLELPGVANKNVSIRVQAPAGVKVSATRNEPGSAEKHQEKSEVEEVMPEEKPETSEEKMPEAPAETASQPQVMESQHDDLLHLNCPKCGGELVLRREHLGVDGACVWCEAPIVASVSAKDGEVKVFPVFQPGPPAPRDEVVEAPVTEAAEIPEASEPEAPAPEPVSPPKPETEEPVVERAPLPEISQSTFEEASMGWGMSAEPATEEAPEPASGFDSSPLTGFSGEPAPAEMAPSPAESAEEMPPPMEEPVKGFSEAPKEEPATGFSDAPKEEPAKGFSEAPEEGVPSDGFDASSFSQTSWGAPPDKPAIECAIQASSHAENKEGESAEAAGWSGDMVAPIKVAPATEGEKALLPEGFGSPSSPLEGAAAAGFEAPVEAPADEIAPSMNQDQPAASESFSGFASPDPMNEAEKAPVEDSTPSPAESVDHLANDHTRAVPVWGQPAPEPETLHADADRVMSTPFSEPSPSAPAAAPSLDEEPAAMGFSGEAAAPVGFLSAPPSQEPTAVEMESGGFESAKPAMVTETPSPAAEPQESQPAASDGFGTMAGFGSSPASEEDAQPSAFGEVEAAPTLDAVTEEASASTFEIPSSTPAESAFGNLPPAMESKEDSMGAPAQESFGASATESPGLPAPEPDDAAPSDVPQNAEPPAPEPAASETASGDAFMSGISGGSEAGSSMFSSGATTGSSLFGTPPGEPDPEPVKPESTPAVEVEVETEVVDSPSDPEAPASMASEPAPAPETPQTEEAGSPQVTSQPLGKKPRKTVRKGFVVMIVIILGFVCGAALASYVLPVDQYVAKARAFMDQKFNPSSSIEMAPGIPTNPAPAPATPGAPPVPAGSAMPAPPTNPLSPTTPQNSAETLPSAASTQP